MIGALLGNLQECAGSPVCTDSFRCADAHTVGDVDGVALLAEFLVGFECEHDVAFRRFAGGNGEFLTEHCCPVGGEAVGNGFQFRCLGNDS